MEIIELLTRHREGGQTSRRWLDSEKVVRHREVVGQREEPSSNARKTSSGTRTTSSRTRRTSACVKGSSWTRRCLRRREARSDVSRVDGLAWRTIGSGGLGAGGIALRDTTVAEPPGSIGRRGRLAASHAEPPGSIGRRAAWQHRTRRRACAWSR